MELSCLLDVLVAFVFILPTLCKENVSTTIIMLSRNMHYANNAKCKRIKVVELEHFYIFLFFRDVIVLETRISVYKFYAISL